MKPRKIKINRILIKAEVRKCFAGTDWEHQDLQTIVERITTKLGVYGEVDDQVTESVTEQVRTKLTEKGRDPDAPVSNMKQIARMSIQNEVNLYGQVGGENEEAKVEEPNIYGDPAAAAILFSEAPPPRIISPQDALRVASQQQPYMEEEEDSSESADLYAHPASPVVDAPLNNFGYDWTLDKLKTTIQLQFQGATSWRTVINSVQRLDPNYTDKIAEILYERITTAHKPFSHEEVGNMALSSLDEMYIQLDASRKRDPTQGASNKPPPAPAVAAPAMQEGPPAFVNLYEPAEEPAPVAPAVVPVVVAAPADNDQVARLQEENRSLRIDLGQARQENQALNAEIAKLRASMATMESNARNLAEMLKDKQNEVSDSKRLVNEMSAQTLDFSDESLAVRAQMEEIRQFAIRSHQESQRAASQSMAAPQRVPLQQARPIQTEPNFMPQEGRSPAPISPMQAAPVQAAPVQRPAPMPQQSMSSVVIPNQKVDSTIPDELHSVHFPDPNLVSPWQTTTSYAKTKRNTTKAVVTWTLVDSADNRHVVTFEHNHYSFRGKSKRKCIIDRNVVMSEKTGNMNYRFNLPGNQDTVTIIIINGPTGFQYELMVNDLNFVEAKRYYIDIQNAIRQSMMAASS